MSDTSRQKCPTLPEIGVFPVGDVDGDEDMDLDDPRWMIDMPVGTVPPDLATADFNGDGQLLLADLQTLVKILVGFHEGGHAMKTLAMVVRQWGLLAPLVSLVFSLPAAHAATCTGIPIAPGQSIQAAVNANPAGTTFCLKAGVHREQKVLPKDDDKFIGEPDAILSGARVLPASSFVPSGSYWFIGGQTQPGQSYNPLGRMIPGYECDEHSEELFVNNATRLRHVCTLAELGPGKWHFDYAGDRIYLYDNPSSFSLIETSVTNTSFYGAGVRNVLVENLVIEKYASVAGGGAIASDGRAPGATYYWTLRYLTLRYNHGAAVYMGPGMVIENCKIHDNGQLGVAGRNVDPSNGFSAPAVFRNSEVYRNKVLGYEAGWEGGGTKWALTRDMTVENSWFHDNYGPGIWFDVFNENSMIRSNLVERNGDTNGVGGPGLARGLFYEINDGPAKIYWNIVRNHLATQIHNSNSANVEIYENAIYGPHGGINISENNRAPHVINSYVHDNDIATSTGNHIQIGSVNGLNDILSRGTIDKNIYRGNANDKKWFAGSFWSCCNYNFSGWQGLGLDVNSRVLSSGTPALPAGAVPFTPSQYGQQSSTGTLPSISLSVTDASASETGLDAAVFTITYTGSTASSLVVSYSITGTATNGTDYVAISSPLTIPAGAASETVTITPIDDTVVEAGETVVLTLSPSASYTIGSPSSGSITIADNDSPPPSTNPLAHWKFDEASGTTATDASGNGNTGVLINGPVWNPSGGKIGGALQLNGSNQYVSTTDIDFTSAPFTLSAWFNTPSAAGQFLLGKYTAGTNQIYLTKTTAGGILAGLYDGTAWQEVNSGALNLHDDQWHLATMVVTPTNIDLYVDGIYRGTDTHDNTFPVNDVPWELGRRSDNTSYFAGLLDDVRIYNRALSQTEIQALATPSSLLGDLDGDGTVDLDDVRTMIYMLIGTLPPDLTKADLDGDGQLLLADLRALVKILVGIP